MWVTVRRGRHGAVPPCTVFCLVRRDGSLCVMWAVGVRVLLHVRFIWAAPEPRGGRGGSHGARAESARQASGAPAPQARGRAGGVAAPCRMRQPPCPWPMPMAMCPRQNRSTERPSEVPNGQAKRSVLRSQSRRTGPGGGAARGPRRAHARRAPGAGAGAQASRTGSSPGWADPWEDLSLFPRTARRPSPTPPNSVRR